MTNKAQDYEEAYREIVELYDIAEALVNTVEDPNALYQTEQMDILESLVDEVVTCSDELSEQFCSFADADDKVKASKKFKFRPSFKHMFKAVNQALDQVFKQPAEMAENMSLTMMPTLGKLVTHSEKLFNMLVTLVERVKDVVTKRREFREMVMREAHIATMVNSQQIAIDGTKH